MAEDVCDSWEEMLENETLTAKLDKMKFDGSNEARGYSSTTAGVSSSTTTLSTKTDGSDESKIVNSCNGNGIKILKRPTAMTTTTTNVKSSSSSSLHTNSLDIGFDDNCGNGSSFESSSSSSSSYSSSKAKGKSVDSFVDPEPFIPSNHKMPQITLEDNTRTQYVPQVRILKRPKDTPAGSKSGPERDDKVSPSKSNVTGNMVTKSYQEREAEYAKVRLRILGSAVPDYKDSDLGASSPTSNSNLTASRTFADATSLPSGSKATDQPFLRLPQGPDGSKGFASRR